MTWYISINKQTVAKNSRNGTSEPPIRVAPSKSGKGEHCSGVVLPAGSRLIYQPDKPILKCGARLVIECPERPEILNT